MNTQFIEDDKIRKSMSLFDLLKKLWPMTWKYSTQVIFVVVCVILFSVIGRIVPYLFSLTVDEGIGNKNLDLLFKIVVVYAVLEFSRSILSFLLSYKMEKLGNRVLFDLREKLISHTQNLPLQFFDKNPVGRLVTRLTNDVLSIGELYSQGFTAIFLSTIELVTIAIAMIIFSPKMGIATLIVAPIAIYVTGTISLKLRYYFSEGKKKMAQMNAFTSESLSGMKVIRLFSQTARRQEKFQNQAREYRDVQLKTVRYFAFLWPTLSFFNITTVATTLLLGAWLYENAGLTIGTLSGFILYVQGFYSPIRVILEQHNQFQNSLASADRLFHIMDELEEPVSGNAWATNKLRGQVDIKNLSFSYSPSSNKALNNVSLSVSPGESIALVGRTGSGKTTLISLMQRLYDYKEGEILIDGQNIQSLSLSELRSRIGIIQQDNFIFRGSLYDNISLSNPNISRERALKALHQARCTKLLARTNNNLDYEINERGSNLSLGERQLLAFARILAFDSDILILDEATANVDSESERDLQIATEEVTVGRTCFIVAHRLSTIVNCDRIFVFQDGQIVESGDHETLIKQNGHYFELYTKQTKEQTV